jgi:hypothetical protein
MLPDTIARVDNLITRACWEDLMLRKKVVCRNRNAASTFNPASVKKWLIGSVTYNPTCAIVIIASTGAEGTNGIHIISHTSTD